MRCEDVSFPWRLYENPQQIVTTSNIEEVIPLLKRLEAAIEADAEGCGFAEVCGFIAYEAAPAMDPAMVVCASPSPPDTSDRSKRSMPLFWFGVYDQSEKLSALPKIKAADCFVGPWASSRSPEEYGQDFTKIKDHIAAGETYQINYTLGLDATFHGNPYALFYRLYQRQPTPYATFLNIGSHAICSVTPELFFEQHKGTILSKPMKGTRPARGDQEARHASRTELVASKKDRAENTMIVDMIRNDLGRIARPGSVTTPSLFDIEEHPTVWQMTSTVECQSDAKVPEILAATFPCASITGAPKIQSMKIIHDLERRPRGIYTGTIGHFTADKARFSVAIRTAEVDLQQNQIEYGCGGGIVWDSREAAELAECHTKAEVITQEKADFELLETMLYRRGHYFLLAAHLDRLLASAQFFHFPFDREACKLQLQGLAQKLQKKSEKRARVRLLLNSDGRIRLETSSCPREARRNWKIRLAREPIDSTNPFLYHKTTRRDVYRQALEQATDPTGETFDDVLLFNERDELTETTVANILLKIDDRLYTPAVESGLLNGTFRCTLLAHGYIEEKSLTLDDLARADDFFLINSVRGFIQATA